MTAGRPRPLPWYSIDMGTTAPPGGRVLRAIRGRLPGMRRTAASADDEVAFAAFCTHRMISQCDLALLVSCTFTILWWPTDPWLLGRLGDDVLRMFSIMRGLIVGLSLLYALVVHGLGLRRHALPVLWGTAMIILFAIGVGMARLGAPDEPWLYFTYVFPFVTVALPMRLGPRVAFTVSLALANVAGIAASSPEHFRSPYMPMMLSFLTAVILVSIAAGYTLYLALRETFLQSQQLARASAEVKDYSEHLEEKVAERTHELRRVLAHLETAREDERAFISRELHDQLGQELAAQRYALAFTRKRYQDEPAAIARNLDELDDLQGRIALTVRSIVTQLRPVVLDDQGLRAALDWLVRQTAERTGLTCTLVMDGDEAALTGEQPIAIFRIVQEAITNALRHADPQRIAVSVRLGATLEVDIADDGAGFDPAQARPSARGGAGLIGMRERAQALGGDLTVDSRPGAGTTVRLRLPLVPTSVSRTTTPSPVASASPVASPSSSSSSSPEASSGSASS